MRQDRSLPGEDPAQRPHDTTRENLARSTGQAQIPIHDRPSVTDADGHWLPGHHEGDLILGKNGSSAIGTIVKRATSYLWLLHLPDGHTATAVRTAITDQLQHWPEVLKQTITWDRGKELTLHMCCTDGLNPPWGT